LCASAVTFKLRRLPPRMCHPVYSAGRDQTAQRHAYPSRRGYYTTRPCHSRCSLPLPPPPKKNLNKQNI
jgi:hypothetical protein